MSRKKENSANENKRNNLKLDDKIEIFERFFQTGQTLTGKTIFEGYPIGQWAIQIRNNIRRLESGKISGNLPSEEKLETLERLGILQRKKGASIDEKIQAMEDWMKKYPLAKICLTKSSLKVLEQYAKNEKEFANLKEEYKKMMKYYEYARVRNGYGKLTSQQFLKCKEGNIGGVFGFPTYIEEASEFYRN